MPEGHTIHRLASDRGRDLRGRPVVASSPQGRFAASAERLDGATLVRAEAFGKQLFLDWDNGDVLSVHLGLIGKFRRAPVERARSAQARLRLAPVAGAVAWDLPGPMVCELVDPATRRLIAGSIGPDPLRRNGSVDEFVRRSGAKRAPIGAVLLDQQVIAGIGNVYRAEVCFLCGIDPRRPAAGLTEDQLRALWPEPAPPRNRSVLSPPSRESLPAPPSRRSLPLRPLMRSSPAPPYSMLSRLLPLRVSPKVLPTIRSISVSVSSPLPVPVFWAVYSARSTVTPVVAVA